MAALSVSRFSHFFPLRGAGLPVFPTLPLGEWETGKGRRGKGCNSNLPVCGRSSIAFKSTTYTKEIQDV
jgi:hypothetical protein